MFIVCPFLKYPKANPAERRPMRVKKRGLI
nr:MAG TPA: hypothetical protein [Caudoviricetes sp.]